MGLIHYACAYANPGGSAKVTPARTRGRIQCSCEDGAVLGRISVQAAVQGAHEEDGSQISRQSLWKE